MQFIVRRWTAAIDGVETHLALILIVALDLLATTVSQSDAGCVTENYEYAHGKTAEFCVLRGLQDDGRTAPQERFTNVAVLDTRIKQLPAHFFSRFPHLELLVVRNSTLDRLDINGTVRVIYAEGNKIRSLRVDGTSELRELYLRANPIESVASAVSSLPSLEKLDLSDTAIAKEETLEVNSFAGLNNLQELYLVDVRAYYFENEKNRVLPNLRLLDVSRNTFIPTNFDLRLFQAFPRLEVLNLSH
ncbi:leucine-rich repeat-containing protein 4-like, partial [Anopheles cruzii]|uniref:leucine-rich repeat-containing protein 4-like n=1 Tax=Anopheles cruzii TaxID=68878 RepID=UPI0022EC4181